MPREAIQVTTGVAATERVLVPSPSALPSVAAAHTTAGASVASGGVKHTTTVVARGVADIRGRVNVLATWNVAGAGADGLGRLNATITRNGAAIANVTPANGPARSLAAGGSFTEVLAIQTPANLDPAGTDTVEVVLTIEVTTPGTGVRDLSVDHNPPAGNRLLVAGLD